MVKRMKEMKKEGVVAKTEIDKEEAKYNEGRRRLCRAIYKWWSLDHRGLEFDDKTPDDPRALFEKEI